MGKGEQRGMGRGKEETQRRTGKGTTQRGRVAQHERAAAA